MKSIKYFFTLSLPPAYIVTLQPPNATSKKKYRDKLITVC